MKNNRAAIPEDVKLRLWATSGARCEFNNCNKPLWYNGLTFSKSNFAEMSHIIGAKEKGPRGSDDSNEYEKDFNNLMLLCPTCHKEIDDFEDEYSIQQLRDWKKKHEERIDLLTSFKNEIDKTTIIRFTAKIGSRYPNIHDQVAKNAVLPRKWPSSENGIEVGFPDFNRKLQSDWDSAVDVIQRKFELIHNSLNSDIYKGHFSIFAIGPMPLLMVLGKYVSDTIPCDIFHNNRAIKETNNTWKWDDCIVGSTAFVVKQLNNVPTAKNVMLILSISDAVNSAQYSAILEEDFAVYELTIDDPSIHFLKSRQQLEIFSYEYRRLLNTIQTKHGNDVNIHILPAVPAAIAVQCGRVLLPTKDPKIYCYEYFPDSGYQKVLQLN